MTAGAHNDYSWYVTIRTNLHTTYPFSFKLIFGFQILKYNLRPILIDDVYFLTACRCTVKADRQSSFWIFDFRSPIRLHETVVNQTPQSNLIRHRRATKQSYFSSIIRSGYNYNYIKVAQHSAVSYGMIPFFEKKVWWRLDSIRKWIFLSLKYYSDDSLIGRILLSIILSNSNRCHSLKIFWKSCCTDRTKTHSNKI